jgi:hypothetical protein
MTKELRKNREDFLICGVILDFEKEWVDKYL